MWLLFGHHPLRNVDDIPAVIEELAPSERFQSPRIPKDRIRSMSNSNYCIGDWVIYRKQKTSTSPGPRAKSVRASASGETYQYMVDKFWVVQAVDDGEILLRTRRGKENRISPDDPRLRMPTWWEKLIYRNRFQEVEKELPESA